MEYHEPPETLNEAVKDHHRVLRSIIEELEAVDWYIQRADVTSRPLLRRFLLHNAKEEMEHAVMGFEYLRRVFLMWEDMIDEHLYTDGEYLGEYDGEFDVAVQTFLEERGEDD